MYSTTCEAVLHSATNSRVRRVLELKCYFEVEVSNEQKKKSQRDESREWCRNEGVGRDGEKTIPQFVVNETGRTWWRVH